MSEDAIPRDLVDTLRSARDVMALCGAGVSAESGIPTFRDVVEGHWANVDPTRIASPEGFAADPASVTRWYDQRRIAAYDCQPNPGHHALVAMQRHVEAAGGRFTLVTQNVDGLHQRAGSGDVIELHGSIHRWRCSECRRERVEAGGPFEHYPPRCEACGGARRPAVVWFGELLPVKALHRAQQGAETCELFFSLGTSGTVEPAASLALTAARVGARTCEINLEPTPMSRRLTWPLRGRTGKILPSLVREAFR